MLFRSVSEQVNVPVWAKLSANTDRLLDIVESVTGAGASAVTLINTMLGMQIDTSTARPTLGNGGGGLSGASIHPIAVRAVYDVSARFPGIDIVGVGGISSGADAVEMMMAGARCVQVGTATFARPDACARVLAEAATIVQRRGGTSWSSVHRLAHA